MIEEKGKWRAAQRESEEGRIIILKVFDKAIRRYITL